MQHNQVKACLLYGADNPIEGIVLDVLLRKVREIKRSTGINVPFPEDSQSIIDTITQSLLLNPDRRIQTRETLQEGTLFDFSDFGEAKENVTRKIDEAAEREKAWGHASPRAEVTRLAEGSQVRPDLDQDHAGAGEVDSRDRLQQWRGRRKSASSVWMGASAMNCWRAAPNVRDNPG